MIDEKKTEELKQETPQITETEWVYYIKEKFCNSGI